MIIKIRRWDSAGELVTGICRSAKYPLRIFIIVGFSLFGLLLCSLTVASSEPTERKSTVSSRDQSLLDDLPDTIDSTDASKNLRQQGLDGDKELLDDLNHGEDFGNPASRQLTQIVRRMKQSEQSMIDGETSAKIQTIQRDVLARIDELLDKAGHRLSSDQENISKQTGRQNARHSPNGKEVSQETGKQESQLPQQTKLQDRSGLEIMIEEIWGHLPEHLRRHMTDSLTDEQFLPKYEQLIEQYFKRLAEEQRIQP